MIAIIASKANESVAREYAQAAEEQCQVISPTKKDVIYGISKVVIVGDHPSLVKRYRGICPVETIGSDLEEAEPIKEAEPIEEAEPEPIEENGEPDAADG